MESHTKIPGNTPGGFSKSKMASKMAAMFTKYGYLRITFTFVFKSTREWCHFKENLIFYEVMPLFVDFMMINIAILAKNANVYNFSQIIEFAQFCYCSCATIPFVGPIYNLTYICLNIIAIFCKNYEFKPFCTKKLYIPKINKSDFQKQRFQHSVGVTALMYGHLHWCRPPLLLRSKH